MIVDFCCLMLLQVGQSLSLPAHNTAPAGRQMSMIPLHLIMSGSALGNDLPGGN